MQCVCGVPTRRSAVARRLIPLLIASGLLLAAMPAQAQFPGDVPDTFRLRLGAMYAWFNTSVTFQENITQGGPIGGGVSLENVLGMPQSTAGFNGWGSWNFAGRSFIDFGYVGFSRGRTQTLSRDVTFGDSTYTAGASVSATSKSNLPYIDYSYGFVKNENVQFGLSLGVAYPILEAELSAAAGVIGPGGPVVGNSVTKSAKLSTPVPLLGLNFDGRLADGLSGGIRVLGIFAPVHPYVGSVFEADAHLDWYATHNFGIGAAYGYTKVALKKEETNSFIDFSYRYDGPRLFLIVTF